MTLQTVLVIRLREVHIMLDNNTYSLDIRNRCDGLSSLSLSPPATSGTWRSKSGLPATLSSLYWNIWQGGFGSGEGRVGAGGGWGNAVHFIEEDGRTRRFTKDGNTGGCHRSEIGESGLWGSRERNEI